MPYNPALVAPMRAEVTRLGAKELTTAAEVDAALGDQRGSMLVFVNSVCGCAAGKARPGIALALQHQTKPDVVATVTPPSTTSIRAGVTHGVFAPDNELNRWFRATYQEHAQILRHVLRNALIPVVTIIGVQLGNLLAGTIIVETVFSRRGMGRLAVTAVLDKDYPLIQGIVLLFSFVYVLVNLAVDVLYTLLDPRIRY